MPAQNEIGEAQLTIGGKSSATHHKNNPVAAEILVALARFNATQLSGVHQTLVHELERSGTLRRLLGNSWAQRRDAIALND